MKIHINGIQLCAAFESTPFMYIVLCQQQTWENKTSPPFWMVYKAWHPLHLSSLLPLYLIFSDSHLSHILLHCLHHLKLNISPQTSQYVTFNNNPIEIYLITIILLGWLPKVIQIQINYDSQQVTVLDPWIDLVHQVETWWRSKLIKYVQRGYSIDDKRIVFTRNQEGHCSASRSIDRSCN